DNALYGGDAAFYYKGKYSREGENRISANVEVVDYSGKKQSVLGPLGMFRLALTGVGKDQQLTLVGQVEGQPNLRISIILKKVDELVEA
ncbi:MAG TPA: GrlR family regulatory protein, partial [Nitrospiraceae bacterium]|nr:GrlR family regulatory protein [Nitrospiraceae bacterium]